jgi:putative ABC transport system permease protein
MRIVTRIFRFSRRVFGGQRAERELDEEVHSYVAQLTEEKIGAGLSPDEAFRQARLELGGIEQVKQQVREVLPGAFMDSRLQDLRYAARMLRKSPGFSIVAILTLALGMGATTAIFSVMNAVLLNPLPIRDPNRVVVLHDQLPMFDVARTKVSPLQFREFSERTELFESSAAWKPASLTLTGKGQAFRLQAIQTSYGLFALLGIDPLLGRVFTGFDDTFGNPHVAILSEKLWRRQFNRDRSIIGSKLQLDGNPYEIVGVVPDKLEILYPRADVWVPAAISAEAFAEKYRWYVDYFMLARLRSGVSVEQARAGMQAALAGFNENAFNFGVEIRPILEEEVGDIRRPLFLLFGAVGLVLLVACTNVGNLLLARNIARNQEIATRVALGAGRGRILAQLLTESLLLSMLGGALGLLLARMSLSGLIWMAPVDLPRVSGIGLDIPVLLFAFALSGAAAVLFGLAPAIASTRANLAGPLRSGRGAGDRHRHRLSRVLVVSEISITLMLMIGAGLLLRSFANLLQVPLGFEPNNVLTARVSLSPAISTNPTQFSNKLLDRILALPGVQHAAIATGAPFTSDGYDTTFDIRDHHVSADEPIPHAGVMYVTPDYFETLKIPFLTGRPFTLADMRATNWLDKGAVRIIDETLAKRFWHDRNPLGAQIGNQGQWATIVGVVGAVRDQDLASAPQGIIYIPGYAGSTLLLRTAPSPQMLTAAVREQVRSVSTDVAVYDSKTMSDLVATSLSRRKFASALLACFAATALLLSFVAVYSVTAYLVTQRAHEFGLRMALGAQPRDLLKMVLGASLAMSLAGVTLGLAGSLAARQVLASQLFGVGPTDSFTSISVSVFLLSVAIAASFLPARRATQVDPMVALRHE